MSYKELQKRWVEEYGLQKGDRVKVIGCAKHDDLGWPGSWINRMDNAIGQTLTIVNIIGCYGIVLDDNSEGLCFTYPFFVLVPQHEVTTDKGEVNLPNIFSLKDEGNIRPVDPVDVYDDFQDYVDDTVPNKSLEERLMESDYGRVLEWFNAGVDEETRTVRITVCPRVAGEIITISASYDINPLPAKIRLVYDGGYIPPESLPAHMRNLVVKESRRSIEDIVK